MDSVAVAVVLSKGTFVGNAVAVTVGAGASCNVAVVGNPVEVAVGSAGRHHDGAGDTGEVGRRVQAGNTVAVDG